MFDLVVVGFDVPFNLMSLVATFCWGAGADEPDFSWGETRAKGFNTMSQPNGCLAAVAE